MATTYNFKPEQMFNADAWKSFMGGGSMFEDTAAAARKNMEALTVASREAAEAAKTMAQSQANYARTVMEDASEFWRDWMSSGSDMQDKVEIQNKAARDGFAKAVAHNKELADIWQKSQERMLRTINDSISENVDSAVRTASKAARK